ncbi:hypothetical protein [Acidisoma sp. S159]|uniref:hypothetical protein n=1 Tax=Acidisoma sp. S159 TaxID=1747225 RepID=UPI00131E09C0|nr:hypothetical protein [Acidisoma sp. S159]
MTGLTVDPIKALAALRDTPLWLLVALAGCSYVVGISAVVPLQYQQWAFLGCKCFVILAFCRAVYVVSGKSFTVWWRIKRTRLNFSIDDRLSFWNVDKQSDGWLVTQFRINFAAKNLTDKAIYFTKARIIKPRGLGEVLYTNLTVSDERISSSGSARRKTPVIFADSRADVQVMVIVMGRPRTKTHHLDIVAGLADEDGRESKLRTKLRKV